VKQSNNKSIVNTDLYPDGIIYKDAATELHKSGSYYYVEIIRKEELSETWQAGCLYKI
jgi:hypothetical protein